jgi:hypothetical protein
LTRFGAKVGCYMTDDRVAETAARWSYSSTISARAWDW